MPSRLSLPAMPASLKEAQELLAFNLGLALLPAQQQVEARLPSLQTTAACVW